MNQLPAVAGKSTGGHAENFRRAARKQHLLRFHMVEIRDFLCHFVILTEGIPIHQRRRGKDGLSHFGGRAISILIAVQPDQSIGLGRSC